MKQKYKNILYREEVKVAKHLQTKVPKLKMSAWIREATKSKMEQEKK